MEGEIRKHKMCILSLTYFKKKKSPSDPDFIFVVSRRVVVVVYSFFVVVVLRTEVHQQKSVKKRVSLFDKPA